ncbi:MAG: amino acid decarboxylase [Acidobacteria bacterium]|nr:amino acid decarboxylase [Acidobacteriota bacterium]
MSPEEFREWGHKFVDWVADYLSHPERYPVLSQVEPGSIHRQLPPNPPLKPEPIEAMLRDIDKIIVPGVTHWNHPAFFAYFAVTGSFPGILGELLSAAFNVNGMLWRTSPAFTELEEHVLGWLRLMLGLPENFMGVVYDTASTSTFHALAAAREAITEYNVSENGICGPKAPRLRMYTSTHAHSSVDKAAMAIGLGRRGIMKIGVDEKFQMNPSALEEAVNTDLSEGWRPFCVSATVGTTSTTSIDPIPRIADICEKYKLWLHVDAAYAGAAAILPEMRWILDGCERADSFVMNPHKWLFTPIDFSAFYCRRPDILKRAFSLTPEYLRTAEADKVTNYMDYGIQLGRRFRSIKFWMVVRYFGVEGLQERLREHIRLGKLFASWVEADKRFELMAPVPFSTVCFRIKADDAPNQQLIDKVNSSGKIFISHTKLHDKLTLRFTIGNLRTTEEHVRMAWDLIAKTAGG